MTDLYALLPRLYALDPTTCREICTQTATFQGSDPRKAWIIQGIIEEAIKDKGLSLSVNRFVNGERRTYAAKIMSVERCMVEQICGHTTVVQMPSWKEVYRCHGFSERSYLDALLECYLKALEAEHES